jgi:hypothetical protein
MLLDFPFDFAQPFADDWATRCHAARLTPSDVTDDRPITEEELRAWKKRLENMSITAVEAAYRNAYWLCKLQDTWYRTRKLFRNFLAAWKAMRA